MDSYFDQVGGKLMETFSGKWSNLGIKVDTVPGLSMSVVTNKVDMVGTKVDLTKVKFTNKRQMSFSEAKMAIKKRTVALYLCGQLIIN